jgi:hypothetical protein
MHPRLWLAGVIALTTGCAHRFATPSELRTPAAPETVFTCAKQQLGALGYKQSSVDTDELRVNATKVDLVSRRSDTQFRRIVNKLQVDVSPEADGQTSLAVVAQTFAEYTTQRGPTEVEENSSEAVKEDAQRLLEACRN